MFSDFLVAILCLYIMLMSFMIGYVAYKPLNIFSELADKLKDKIDEFK